MGSFGAESPLIAGRYRLESRLGRGGMGTVWRATDQLLGRQVAVKELHMGGGLTGADAPEQRERTLREARTVARFSHPNVVVVHDVVEQTDGPPWIVMELVDGLSLADRLAADGPVEPREAARIGLALLGALRVAHGRGVLHRDLKPANVLLESGSGRVVLTDFGIAHVSDGTTITESGSFVGSPEYTAPERMSGARSGPESDLWSLGVLLCAALSGSSPFRRDSIEGVVHAVVAGEIRPPEAAGPLLPVVRGLLERDPERRLTAPEAERLLKEYLLTGRTPEPGPAAARRVRPPVPGTGAPEADEPLPGGPARLPAAGRGMLGDRRPVRPGGTRARTVMAAALLVVAAGGAGVAGVATLMKGNGGSLDDRPSATASGGKNSSGPSSAPPSSPSPTVTVTETPGGPVTRAPRGYRMVSDPAGFRLAVPEGFTRSFEPPRVYYYGPGKAFRIGVHVQDQEPGGPMAVMRKADEAGPDRYRGYRDSEVRATTQRGHRAAFWQFVWDGLPGDGGSRHTVDLSWDEGGKMYDVWVSSPVGERSTGRRHFDRALETFVRTKPSS